MNNTLYNIIEYLISFAEGMLIFSIITQVGGRRYDDRRKHILLLMGITVIETLVVSIMNTVQAFSFSTIIVCFVVDTVLAKVTSNGNLRLRIVGNILAIFILHTIDYILGFSIALIIGKVSDIYSGFDVIMEPGYIRVLFHICDKLIQTLIYFSLRRFGKRINTFNTNSQYILIALLILAYIVVSILMNMIVANSPIIMQSAIILSWIFILICMLAIIALLYITVQFHSQKNSYNLMRGMNSIMEKSYMQMDDNLKQKSKQLHDFKNHLSIIRGLSDEKIQIENYIDSLVNSFSKIEPLCISGNEYIDAIINCKSVDAKDKGIEFSYAVQLSDVLELDPVDICAILSNQIDNAFEACEKIVDIEERRVQVTIGQRQQYTYFKVENSIVENSVRIEDLNKSSKSQDTQLHGLGIQNITAAVEKYNGTLHNEISAIKFTSIAMVMTNGGDRNA